jgi:hypothetical protein
MPPSPNKELTYLDTNFLRQRAAAAFLAIAERLLAVIVTNLRFPPIFPPFRPISDMYADTCATVNFGAGCGSSGVASPARVDSSTK